MRNWNKFAASLCVVVLGFILIVSIGPGKSSAEPATPQTTQEPSPVVMIALPWDDSSVRIPAPQQFRALSASTATFSINYLPAGTTDRAGATCLAWPSSAQTAFSYAANVWATMITSAVPIKIDACWANLGSPDVLGYSGSLSVRNFTGAPQSGTWYSYSLADALAGIDLDPTGPDTYITYNNGFSWYFGTDGSTPAGQYDFVSVVMHEMGHGLNFAGTMSYGSSRCGGASNGCWGGGTGYPGIYDRFVENGTGQALLNTGLFPNPSAALGSQLTSSNLYFDGPNANAANGGSPVKIYAPSTWAQGSSYSHLDYNTFASTPNRLMVYAIAAASSVHDPGPVAMGLLKDLGWNLNNPVPTITGLNPTSATAGGSAFTLTVNGTNFVGSSVVRWNGSNRTTTYVSATQLTAAITAADIGTAGTANVTVFNPSPGGGTSNAVSFSVNPNTGNPVPTITGLNPSSATPGGAGFTLTVNGTNFISSSVVRWKGADRTTTYVSSTQLTAAILASDIAAAGSASVTVFNPAPGGGLSNAVSFLVSTSKKVYLPLVVNNYQPPGSWTTIVSTDFEGAWPGAWAVSDNSSADGGQYYWGKRNCRAYAGSYSGWGVGGGAQGSGLSCGASYPNNARSWMVYGPFSLSNTAAADLRFKLWLYSELDYDGVCRFASIDGNNFWGNCASGNSNGWVDMVLDLTNVYTLGNLLGQPKVWVAIYFSSDASNTYAVGGYVDNIVLRKCSGGGTCPAAVSEMSPGDGQVVESAAHVVIPK